MCSPRWMPRGSSPQRFPALSKPMPVMGDSLDAGECPGVRPAGRQRPGDRYDVQSGTGIDFRVHPLTVLAIGPVPQYSWTACAYPYPEANPSGRTAGCDVDFLARYGVVAVGRASVVAVWVLECRSFSAWM